MFSNFGCSNQEEVTETPEKTEVEMKEAAEGWVKEPLQMTTQMRDVISSFSWM